MSVCNVKVEYIRPQYQNLSEWCQDCNNVYIGRRGIVLINSRRYPEQNSIWANPFKLTGDSEDERQDILRQYYYYISDKIVKENLWAQLELLRGKNLGCWCQPKACHGDVLLYILSVIDSWKK